MHRPAFSLLELLVVVAIIATLTAILLPTLGQSRDAARAAVCQSHLHQTALATAGYHHDFAGRFWRYYAGATGGRQWWFGFEPGGPGSGPNRPLDKGRAVLADYLGTADDAFNCPVFPYDHPRFFPKFDRRAASLGFNLHLGPVGAAPAARVDHIIQPAAVFTFADAIHFDGLGGPGTFNEGHYLQYTPGAAMMSGYAHFRHQRTAHALFADGHVAPQTPATPAFAGGAPFAGGPISNLASPDGSARIYGP